MGRNLYMSSVLFPPLINDSATVKYALTRSHGKSPLKAGNVLNVNMLGHLFQAFGIVPRYLRFYTQLAWPGWLSQLIR